MSMSNKDANQVLRSAFSDADGALKTVPAASTTFAIELDATDGDSVEVRAMAVDSQTIMNAVSAASNANSTSVEMLKYKSCGVIVSASSLTGTLDGTVKLQVSNDGSVWADTVHTATLDSANKVVALTMADMHHKHIRVQYTKNNISGGSLTATIVLKG